MDEDEIWRSISRGHRSSIQKAKKSGVRIERTEPTPHALTVFNSLYYRTMQRNGAAERWFFPQDYFSNCLECLGEDRATLFFAYLDDKVVSAYLVIHDFSTAYYHFGGSDDGYFDFKPNNLLMYETAMWAKQKGYSRYHLGGGVTSSPSDNLFAFKVRFSGKTAGLYTYSCILHEQTYSELCSYKIAYEEHIFGHSLSSDYFPLYRR
jgi:lipid II:glycine glycyltransferase (peptidoglycan interpeptide bridge formation enzyme)